VNFILQVRCVQLCDEQWFTEEDFFKHFVMGAPDDRCRGLSGY
jgi:hypothetical protein